MQASPEQSSTSGMIENLLTIGQVIASRITSRRSSRTLPAIIPAALEEGAIDVDELAERLATINSPKPMPESPITFLDSPKTLGKSDRSPSLTSRMSFRIGSLSSTLSWPRPPDETPPEEILFDKQVWQGQETCRTNKAMRRAFSTFVTTSSLWSDRLTMDLIEHYPRRRKSNAQEITFNDYHIRDRCNATDTKEMDAVANIMYKCTQLKIKDSAITEDAPSVYPGFSECEMQYVLLTTLWPLFRSTGAYAAALAGARNSFVFQEDCPLVRPSEPEKVQMLRELFVSTAVSMSETDLSSLLTAGRWVSGALAALDALPFALSVCAADISAFAYPIVFVNEQFEQVSGYGRSEAIGSGLEMLQCAASDPLAVSKVAEGMTRADTVKVAITNQRKDRSEFLNFLALRPVLTREARNHTFAVAVHFDITRPEASLRDMRAVADCMAVVCTMLKV